MTFPVYIEVFGASIHPHALFECLAYFAGARLYFFLRKRWNGPVAPLETNVWLLTACVVGALTGAKLLAWIESPVEFWEHRHELAAWLGGKTIVGGLLGGWAAIEVAKKILRVEYSTGDLYVFPIILGACIGRIGCFLTGLDDHTHGIATALPWGVDFGDGIQRHPTQLYEIAFFIVLALSLLLVRRRKPANGFLFRMFICGYLFFRFFIEFLKPRHVLTGGLSSIQVASLLGGFYAGWLMLRMRHSTAERCEIPQAEI